MYFLNIALKFPLAGPNAKTKEFFEIKCSLSKILKPLENFKNLQKILRNFNYDQKITFFDNFQQNGQINVKLVKMTIFQISIKSNLDIE